MSLTQEWLNHVMDLKQCVYDLLVILIVLCICMAVGVILAKYENVQFTRGLTAASSLIGDGV